MYTSQKAYTDPYKIEGKMGCFSHIPSLRRSCLFMFRWATLPRQYRKSKPPTRPNEKPNKPVNKYNIMSIWCSVAEEKPKSHFNRIIGDQYKESLKYNHNRPDGICIGVKHAYITTKGCVYIIPANSRQGTSSRQPSENDAK